MPDAMAQFAALLEPQPEGVAIHVPGGMVLVTFLPDEDIDAILDED